jgi:hypothetical protein
MTQLGHYCKAYELERLEEFSAWPADASARLRATPPAEDDPGVYVFVHDGLVVTEGIFLDEDVLFDGSHPDWPAFCRDVLAFDPTAMDQ